mmetsp:Transcript_10829/g.31034  ORF Transcript_10829/g.31034 Transcript_10829/m.31034 type:complete len:566 (-) Transcript_10829:61-1758(-)
MPPQMKTNNDETASAISLSSSTSSSSSRDDNPVQNSNNSGKSPLPSSSSKSSSRTSSSKKSSKKSRKSGSRSSGSGDGGSGGKSRSSSSSSRKSSSRSSSRDKDRDKDRSKDRDRKERGDKDKEKDKERGEKDKDKSSSSRSSSTKRPKERSSRHSRSINTSPVPPAKEKVAPPPVKRNVSFNPKLQVTLIPCLQEFTVEEIHDTWFQSNEYGAMEDECDVTSQLMDQNKVLTDSICGRGLECWTTEGEKMKEQNVSVAIDLVWNAQIEHWKDTAANAAARNADPQSQQTPPELPDSFETISKLYCKISVPCLEEAQSLGQKDEKAVRGYLAAARSMEKARKNMQSLAGNDLDFQDPSLAEKKIKPILKKPVSTKRSASERLLSNAMSGGSSRRLMGSMSSLSSSNSSVLASPGGKIRRSSLMASMKSPSVSSFAKQQQAEQHELPPRLLSKSQSTSNVVSPIPTASQRTSASSSSKAPLSAASASSSMISSNSTGKSPASSSNSNKSSRKISYRPKHRSKIPLSPTNSMCSALSESSAYRKGCAVSVASSEENSLRRKLKAPIL